MTWGVEHLSVWFGSGRPALDDVTLEAAAGEVTAVVGGDGAGKTTLLRVLAGVPVPHRGRVHRPPPGRVGFMPSTSGALRDLTVDENLGFVADANRIRPGERGIRLLERAGLAPFRKRLARDLSGGMRQKLGVVMAMLPEPDLLVLDEPTTGVDPVSRSEVWRLIGTAAAAGAAVVLATAYLDEAERATSLVVLHHGRELLSGTPEEVKAAIPGAVVDTDVPADPARAWPRGARWREWVPEGSDEAAAPDLEDAVIVAALDAGEGR
jgi:ABC-2 type transport system ATP-binding protein